VAISTTQKAKGLTKETKMKVEHKRRETQKMTKQGKEE